MAWSKKEETPDPEVEIERSPGEDPTTSTPEIYYTLQEPQKQFRKINFPEPPVTGVVVLRLVGQMHGRFLSEPVYVPFYSLHPKYCINGKSGLWLQEKLAKLLASKEKFQVFGGMVGWEIKKDWKTKETSYS